MASALETDQGASAEQVRGVHQDGLPSPGYGATRDAWPARFELETVLDAGFIAGLIFLILEMVMVPLLLGGSPWGPPRMIAAIAMGKGVLPPPPLTFDGGVLVVAMLVHCGYTCGCPVLELKSSWPSGGATMAASSGSVMKRIRAQAFIAVRWAGLGTCMAKRSSSALTTWGAASGLKTISGRWANTAAMVA